MFNANRSYSLEHYQTEFTSHARLQPAPTLPTIHRQAIVQQHLCGLETPKL